ncbi:N-acetylmuramoyl-L-alanine amidase [Denitratisoma sp. agr-D3]
MRAIDTIVIHCSATPNGVSLFRGVPGEKFQTTPVLVIDRMHGERKPPFRRDPAWVVRWNPGLLHIGYHFVLYTNGYSATGRALDEVGAHVAGHNAHSIGICMIGTDAFTRHQWDELKDLVNILLKQYPKARVCGHRDLSPDLNGDGIVEPREWIKTCPGFNVADWLAGGKEPLAGHIIEGDG